MSAVAICTDSSALLAPDFVERHDITVVPIPIALDGEPFEERADAVDGFYERLLGGTQATTSQPNPAAFAAAYASSASGGATEVLSVHLDRRASGVLDSAELAAREAQVAVLLADTRTVSYGVAVCVRAVADALARGRSARQAADVAASVGSTIRNVFVAPGARAGRIPDVSAWSLLQFAEGSIRPGSVCGSLHDSIDGMVDQVARERASVLAAVGHASAQTAEPADALADALSQLDQVESVERYRVGPAVGAHTGPLSFGAFWWPSGRD